MIVEELFGSGILNLVYSIMLLISFLFALLSLIGAGLEDILDFAIDADADGLDFISVSPFALATFGAVFGLAGLLTRIWLEMEAIPSILIASASGLVFGAIAHAIFIYLLSPTKSSHFSLEEDAIGREAEVIIAIPIDGRGQIAYNNFSGRVTLGARSTSGEPIRSGQLVTIKKIVGRIAQVAPVEDNN